jgi:hypothetical protein
MRRAASRVRLEAPSWVLSYADVMSLLLVLFVFLCGTGRFPLSPAERRDATTDRIAHAAEPLISEFHALESAAFPDEEALEPGAPLVQSVFFERGSAVLSAEARAQLEEAAPILRRSRLPLMVVGHVSPLLDPHEVLPAGDAHDLAFERALQVTLFLESLPGFSRKSWPELLPASAGFGVVPPERLGADLHDDRDRVDIHPLAPRGSMP